MLEVMFYAIGETWRQMLIAAFVVAFLIVAIGSLYRNQAVNVAAAAILGFVVVTVPSLVSQELWLNNALWIVASLAIYAILEAVRKGPALDFNRPLIGINRRRSAMAAVRSEVRKAKLSSFKFEVER